MTPYSTQAGSYDKAEEDWSAVIALLEHVRESEEDSDK